VSERDSAPPAARTNAISPYVVPALALLSAALVVSGFFLPWLDGTAEFAARDFSGFDLARLVRNFEIAASSEREEGGLRVTAVVLYLVPALAVNGAAFAVIPPLRRWATPALGIAAAYALFVLVATGVLAAVSWTELEGVMGGALVGFYVSLAGAGLLAIGAVIASRMSTTSN
jgi:hypothetical protein